MGWTARRRLVADVRNTVAQTVASATGGGQTAMSFEDAFNKAAFTQVRDNVAKALRGATCPEHHKHPTRVEVTGRALKSLSWQASGWRPKRAAGGQRAPR